MSVSELIWQARTLAERAIDPPAATAAGRARAEHWREALGDRFEDRCRAAGLVPDGLAAALSEDVPPAEAPVPDWWRRLDAALAADAGAEALAERLADWVRARLAEHPAARADAITAYADGLVLGLRRMARRAVELDQAAGQAIGDDTPTAARDLLLANPGLARLLSERTALAVGAGGDLLAHLEADLAGVGAEVLGDADTSAITAITALGDRHDGGRRVLRITFASGAEVMYKPRSLGADAAYADLLRALGRFGFEPGFDPPRVWAAGPDRGWQAVAAPASCTTPVAVERYFRRLGGQLALVHALRATDMHQDNLIAAGEHPVLVDLETLLQPRLGGNRMDDVDPVVHEGGIGSVLRVGLLPRPDGPMGADLSGLGRDPAAGAHVSGGWVAGVRSGSFAPAEGRLPHGDNAARLGGEPVRPSAHVDALAAGFELAYDLLMAHREELLAPGGPLARLAHEPVRIILRPTQGYVELLRRQVTDERCQGDGRSREANLNLLWRSVAGRGDLLAAAPAEHHDLWRGDVPKFTTLPGDRALHHHALGRMEAALGEACPGPEIVRALAPDDRERALSVLRASVLGAASPSTPGPAPTRRRGADFVAPVREAQRAAALDAARRLGVLALRHGERGGWLVLAQRRPPRDGHVLTLAGGDLADGVPGIALALAAVAEATADGRVRALADSARRWGEPPADPGARLLCGDGTAGDDAGEPDAALVLGLIAAGAAPELLARAAEALEPASDLDAYALARAAGVLGQDGPDPAVPATGGPLAAVLAARLSGDADWTALASAALAAPPFAGGIETPALRDGLAGVAVGWLALAEPDPPWRWADVLAVAHAQPRRTEPFPGET